jgi:hypothetical protein
MATPNSTEPEGETSLEIELPADAPPQRSTESRAGAPTLYKHRFADEAKKLCTLGATDIELADFFDVNIATIYRWKNTQPKFCDALKRGKAQADARVERSLYAKATGYMHDSVKIFQNEGVPVIVPYREHVPPDTTACIFWLKNRKPKEWRDVQRHEIEADVTKHVVFTIKPAGNGVHDQTRNGTHALPPAAESAN